MLQLTGSTQPQDWKGPLRRFIYKPCGWTDFPNLSLDFPWSWKQLDITFLPTELEKNHPKSPNLAPKLRFQPPSQQAARWSEVTFSGTVPTARYGYTAVWSEAANGMYIFGWGDSDSPILGAAAGQRWRAPRPKDGRSCAEATSTTCISLIARPPERTEVGEI